MSEKDGVLRLQSSGRWAVCRPGRYRRAGEIPVHFEAPGGPPSHRMIASAEVKIYWNAEAMKRGVPAADLQRQLKEAIRADEAAVQLAQYVHSKMPTLVGQPDAASEHYVIRVPNALPDGQAWAHAVSEVKAITAETQVNGSRTLPKPCPER